MRHATEERTSIRRLRSPKAAARNLIGDPRHSETAERDLHRWEGEGGALGPSAPESVRKPFRAPPAVAFPVARESSDYAIDTIALIEMQRQLMMNEAGMEVARKDALCKLQDALTRAERAGSGTADDAADAEAFACEIERVKTLSQRTANVPHPGKPGTLRLPSARANEARTPIAQPRLRRTQGRGGHH